MATGAANVRKGKEFERWLKRHYDPLLSMGAKRIGHLQNEQGHQLGADNEIGPFRVQAKKGPTFFPIKVDEALKKAEQDAGRFVPALIAATDGDNLGHIWVLRAPMMKRILKLLDDNGLLEELMTGAQFS